MSDRARKIAGALGAKRSGDGKWMACCPAHDDNTPSLSIGSGRNSSLLHCLAGCATDAVLDALLLESHHLFDDGPELPSAFFDAAGSVATKTKAARSSGGRRSGGSRCDPPGREVVADLFTRTVENRRLGKDPGAIAYLRGRGVDTGAIPEHAFGVLGDATSVHASFDRWRRDECRIVLRLFDAKTGEARDVQGRSIAAGGHPKTRFNAGARTRGSVFACARAQAAACGAKSVGDDSNVVIVAEGDVDHLTLLSLGLPFAVISIPGVGEAKRCFGSWARGWTVIAALDNDDAGRQATVKLRQHAQDMGAEVFHDFGRKLPAGSDLNDRLQAIGTEQLRIEIEAMLTDEGEALAGDGVELLDDEGGEVAEPEWAPFPTDALPAHVEEFVRQSAGSIPVDEALIALPVLSVLAGAIGNARRFQARPGFEQPSVLWGLALLPQGSAKSSAFSLARAPLKALRSEEAKTYRTEMDRWERLSPANKRNHSPPAEKFRLVDDCTTEGIARRLASQPRGLILGSDEFSSFFTVGAEYKANSSDTQRWCRFWDAGDLNITRASTSGIYVERAGVSLVGAAQPETFERAANAALWDSGLLPRFMIAMPPSPPRRWAGGVPIDPTVDRWYDEIVRRLYTLPVGSPPLTLSIEGAAVFGEFFDRLNALGEGCEDPAVTALAQKTIANVLRIAGVCELASWAVDDGEREPTQISGATVEGAIVVGEWLLAEARRVWARVRLRGSRAAKYRGSGGPADPIDFVAGRGGAVSLREFYRRRRVSADEAMAEVEGDPRLRLEERKGKNGQASLWVVAAEGPGTEGGAA